MTDQYAALRELIEWLFKQPRQPDLEPFDPDVIRALLVERDELAADLEIAREAQRCECSADDACRFARERDALAADAQRYRWLRERLLAADFAWGDSPTPVLVFSWPSEYAALRAAIEGVHRMPSCGYSYDTKEWEDSTSPSVIRALLAERDKGATAPAAQWQPIETAPEGVRLVFWVVPKTPEETYHDTSGAPILATHKGQVHEGAYGSWGSLSKATHWMQIKEPTE